MSVSMSVSVRLCRFMSVSVSMSVCMCGGSLWKGGDTDADRTQFKDNTVFKLLSSAVSLPLPPPFLLLPLLYVFVICTQVMRS